MERRPEQFRDGEQIAGTPYQVNTLIGTGGMGSVYEVEHLELGRVFVLKALHGHLSSRSDLVGRMRNEWRALAKLNHPHIVQVTDAGQTSSGLPYYVMERLEGRTLGQLLSENGRLSLRRASKIIVDVLKGLDAAHATGAIHRDIKPQNIFVLETGSTKLLDFGIAKLRDRAARVVTAGGISIGTPRYMAPEQAEGGKVDGRADIYAAALVLYECVLGRGPFAHIRDPNMLVMAHIGEEAERVDFLDPSIPAEMGDLLHRWLSKLPTSRPATAGLAVIELESLMKVFPGEYDDSADVTLGGNYDASTVGHVSLESGSEISPSMLPAEKGREDVSASDRPAFSARGTETQAVQESDRPAASDESARQSPHPLTPTATIEAPPQVKRQTPDTLGWGTQVERTRVDETGSKSLHRKRSSKTPPPISTPPDSIETRGKKDKSPRRALMVIAATSIGSFLVAWSAVTLFSGTADSTDQPVSVSTGENSNVEAAATRSAATDSHDAKVLPPLNNDAGPGSTPLISEVPEIQGNSAENANPRRETHEAQLKSIESTQGPKSEDTPPPSNFRTFAPASSKTPASSPRGPRDAAPSEASGEPLPGSGLW